MPTFTSQLKTSQPSLLAWMGILPVIQSWTHIIIMWPKSRGHSPLLHFERATDIITKLYNVQLKVIQSDMTNLHKTKSTTVVQMLRLWVKHSDLYYCKGVTCVALTLCYKLRSLIHW